MTIRRLVPALGGGHVATTLRISSLPLTVTVTIPVDGKLELWRHHVAARAALAAILVAGIAGVVRLLLWQSAKRYEAIARVYETGRALSEQVSLQQALIDAIPLPLSMRDERGVFFRCNRAFLNLTLRQRDEVLGRTSAQVFGHRNGPGVRQRDRRSAGPVDADPVRNVAEGFHSTVAINRRTARPSPCRCVAPPLMSVPSDDAERKRNKSALKESKAVGGRAGETMTGSGTGISGPAGSGSPLAGRRCWATATTNSTTPSRCGRA